MYKLLTHPYAQCGYDVDSSFDHVATFYSYETPIFKIRRVRAPDNDICAVITTIQKPIHSVSTARHVTWALYEQVYSVETARFIRRAMKKLDSDSFITVWYNLNVGVWTIFVGDKCVKTVKR